MTVREFRLPDPGEGLTEAEIVTWRVAVGDSVKVNDIVVEVETAKSLVELPVPFAGTVTGLLVDEGDLVDVGTPIIAVETEAGARPGTAGADPAPDKDAAAATEAAGAVDPGDAADPGEAAEAEVEQGSVGGTTATGRTAVLVGYGVKPTTATRRPRKAPAPAPEAANAAAGDIGGRHEVRLNPTRIGGATALAGHRPRPTAGAEAATLTPVPARQGRPLATPPVRKLAKDLGVDLGSVAGTGGSGVVTREDVRAAAGDPGHPSQIEATGAASGADTGRGRGDGARGERREPIRGVRRIMAQAMTSSAFTAPHVTEWVAVDVTATMDLVARLRQDREFADVKVTPMAVLARAMCLAVGRTPLINSTWDEAAGEVVVKDYVNLGIAAATPRGLVVPTIPDADLLGVRGLATAIADLTATARAGRTSPESMTGGTLTVTNVGVFGIDGGTPIINPGESAILAFGAARRMPWVVSGADGAESIEPRWVSQLQLSFDHRHIDGQTGSQFLADVAAVLHDPARALVWG